MKEHIGVPRPKKTVAFRVQPLLSPDVVASFLIIAMLAAVELDHEPMLVTHEVDDERADGHLATKTETVQAMGAQAGPKNPFGVSHFRSQ
jgi:hypothetical protein